jgi:hypothetical protein
MIKRAMGSTLQVNGLVLLMLVVCSILCGCCRQYLSSEDVVDPKFGDRKEKIAPIFKHGEGRGILNNKYQMQIPISDSVGNDIIISELAKAGVVIDYTDVWLKGVYVPKFRDCCSGPFFRLFNADKWFLDGYCSEYNIGFEFLSKKDYYHAASLPPPYRYHDKLIIIMDIPTRPEYDFFEIAGILRERFVSYDRMTVAVFYDPLTYVDGELIHIAEKSKSGEVLMDSVIAEPLRAQVQDFIAWLRQEGYIGPDDGEEK